MYKIKDRKLTDEVVYMTADEELEYYISQAAVEIDKDGRIVSDTVPVRYRGENMMLDAYICAASVEPVCIGPSILVIS